MNDHCPECGQLDCNGESHTLDRLERVRDDLARLERERRRLERRAIREGYSYREIGRAGGHSHTHVSRSHRIARPRVIWPPKDAGDAMPGGGL